MRQSELKRKTPLKRTALKPSRKPTRRSGFTPASPAQREKARIEPCVVSGDEVVYGAIIDPAHLCARAHGGCDSELCVVPLRRDLHRRFDDGDLDLLPHLIGRRVPELCHALEHYDGSLILLARRLSKNDGGAV